MKLAISLASRGRPEQLVDTIKRSIANWTHPETEMWVQLDDDDAASVECCQAAGFPGSVHINPQPREDTIAAKWNRILSVPADVYSVAADDDPYITPGYDSSILAAAERFPDGIGMVYGHMANLSFTGSLSATKKWCDILGYLQPEHFPYWFCDHWTDDLARMTGRIAFSDHRTDQSSVGKTQELREPAWWANFYDACFLIRRKEAQRIVEQCDNPPWINEYLSRNADLVDQRSSAINEYVRAEAKRLEGWSGLTDAPERYKRVKARAEEMARAIVQDPNMPEPWRHHYSALLFPDAPIQNIQKAFA